ncbi:adenylyl-sulfate kinase [Echinicola sp. CAU 1574]|uniref:Adenylyl-sulfate kinase n=1 Tax=Echinicola arenosa TaxID=2774144 RepID=A0ABR9AP56_9BACT|nr:adenylyl-sulfate kinase [Echinicola arenosa]
MTENIHPTKFKVRKEDRMEKLNQKPVLIWFTGLSGSGKSTLANGTESALHQLGFHTYLLDGDNVRSGLNKDLKFTYEDRVENLRRIAEVSKLMMDAGLIVVSAFISPFVKERETIRDMVGEENFVEIFVDCPLSVCESRDVKGLYKKARKGLIENFTGIDSPYEPPVSPFLRVKSAEEKLENSVEKIIELLKEKISI